MVARVDSLRLQRPCQSVRSPPPPKKAHEQNLGDNGDCAVILGLGPERTIRYLVLIKVQPLTALDNKYKEQPLASTAEQQPASKPTIKPASKVHMTELPPPEGAAAIASQPSRVSDSASIHTSTMTLPIYPMATSLCLGARSNPPDCTWQTRSQDLQACTRPTLLLLQHPQPCYSKPARLESMLMRHASASTKTSRLPGGPT